MVLYTLTFTFTPAIDRLPFPDEQIASMDCLRLVSQEKQVSVVDDDFAPHPTEHTVGATGPVGKSFEAAGEIGHEAERALHLIARMQQFLADLSARELEQPQTLGLLSTADTLLTQRRVQAATVGRGDPVQRRAVVNAVADDSRQRLRRLGQ